MNRWQKRAPRKGKATPFHPTHNDIQAAVEEYLKKGGQITRLEANDVNYEEFMKFKDGDSAVNDFFFES